VVKPAEAVELRLVSLKRVRVSAREVRGPPRRRVSLICPTRWRPAIKLRSIVSIIVLLPIRHDTCGLASVYCGTVIFAYKLWLRGIVSSDVL
jgi:hypothetical protein